MSAKISIIDGKPFVKLGGETLTMPEAILALGSLQAASAEALRKAEADLAEVERKHGIVLANGEEPDRDVLTAAKASIEQAQKAVKTIEADLSLVRSGVIGHEATRMIDTAAADTGLRADLNENLARNVAEMGMRLAVAEVGYGKAQAEVENRRSRANGVE